MPVDEPPRIALDLQQFARGEEALLVGDRVGAPDPGEVGDGREEVLADAFHHPARRFLGERAFVDVFGEDRADRVGEDQFDVRRGFREAARQAGHGAGAAAAENDRVQTAGIGHLPQDLRPGAVLVRRDIVGVAELIDEVGAGGLAGDAFGEILVIVGMALGDVGTGQHDFGAHRLEVEDLLPTHLVGHDQDQLVALLLRDQGQADAGIAGGAFDQGVAGADVAALFGGVDHGKTDAVLDRAAGVLALELEVQLADAGVEPLRLHDRGVGDQFEDGGMDRHAGGGSRRSGSRDYRIAGPVARRYSPRATTADEDGRRRPRQGKSVVGVDRVRSQ